MASVSEAPLYVYSARINVDEKGELLRWSQRLGVTPAALTTAVKAVRNHIALIEDYLSRNPAARPPSVEATHVVVQHGAVRLLVAR